MGLHFSVTSPKQEYRPAMIPNEAGGHRPFEAANSSFANQSNAPTTSRPYVARSLQGFPSPGTGIVMSFVSPFAKRCGSDGFVWLVSRHPVGVSVSTTRSVNKIARRSWLTTRKTTLLDDRSTPVVTTVSVTVANGLREVQIDQ